MAFIKDKAFKWFAIGMVGLFVVLVAAQLVGHALLLLGTLPTRNGLYAVFLTNGQVYFGNISKEDDRSLVLTNIYYLQMTNGGNSLTSADTSDASLLKLGNELHGPEDYMEINRNNVLFLEKLKPDGKVAKAITSYQAK